ncbi:uncharacterized protein LOC106476154 isoform X3 [Limulus polyphemus]|uniref:Uncharacterized protein LOC106476154 isoform X3 n=1 Tax=Limulus polyphemus TaxID=6850 RepID=A0ABM1RWP0_LIMPO|nr:uncharacterized protein LOC106476154 isoform X3 [Limulus polyphemus]
MPVVYKALWITVWGILGLALAMSHDVAFAENKADVPDEYPEIDTFDDMNGGYQKHFSEFLGVPNKKYSEISSDSSNLLAGLNNEERMKRFSEFLGGPGKRFSHIYEDPEKRFSEFLGGPGKRFSEFLGGPGKRFSEFLGGPGKRSIPFPYEIHPQHVHSVTKKLSEFLGGPGK